MSFGIITAMEAAENDVSSDASEVEQAETAVAVAQEVPEVQESAGEVAEVTDNAEAAFEAGEELEAIGDVAQAAVDSGEGLSEDAAAIATIAVERIHEKLFGTREQRIIPAKESFGSSNSRLAATESIVDSVKETIVRIWKGIKQFALRLWDKVSQFFAKIFGSSKLTGKHIANLRERVEKLDPAYQTRGKKIKNASLAKSIAVGAAADQKSLKTIIDNTLSLAKISGNISDERAKLTAILMSLAQTNSGVTDNATLTAWIKGQNGFVTDVERVINASLVAVGTLPTAPVKGANKAGATTTVTGHGHFSGYETLAVSVTTLNGNKTSVSVSFQTAKGKAPDEATALDRAGMLAVLDEAEKLNNSMIDFESVRKNSEKITKGIEGLADTIVKNVTAATKTMGTDATTRAALADMKKSAADGFSLINTLSNSFPSMVVRVVNASTNYVSASMADMKLKK